MQTQHLQHLRSIYKQVASVKTKTKKKGRALREKVRNQVCRAQIAWPGVKQLVSPGSCWLLAGTCFALCDV